MTMDRALYLRVSQDDLDALDAARGAMTRSAFVRAAMHSGDTDTQRASRKPPTGRTDRTAPSSERSSPAHLHRSAVDGTFLDDTGARFTRRRCAVCAMTMPSQPA